MTDQPNAPSHLAVTVKDGSTVGEINQYGHVDQLIQQTARPTVAEERDLRTRALVLAVMERELVEKWLEPLVDPSRRLSIDLDWAGDLVPDTFGDVVARPARSTAAGVPSSVIGAFDASRPLLVLGAPGAGKTVALLELARELIARVSLRPEQPVPVVFPLVSWAAKRPPLTDWMIDQLVERYTLSRPVSEMLVREDHLTVMLDGLDEVPEEARESCVDAINTFQGRRTENFSELVVTCRTNEYLRLHQRLKVSAAISLKPLSDAVITAQLASAGPNLGPVGHALESDSLLHELATAPLVLDLLIRTYSGGGAEELPASGSSEVRLENLFAAYAREMLRHRIAGVRFTQAQSIAWLGWLADALGSHAHDVLFLERLQPEWLGGSRARVFYTLLDRLGFGVLLGAAVGLMVAILLDLQTAFGLAAIVTIAVAIAGRTSEGDRSVARIISAFGLGALATGGVATVLFWPISRALDATVLNAIVAAMIVGAPVTGLTGGPWIAPRRIHLVERLAWSLRQTLRSGVASLCVVAILGASLVLSVGQSGPGVTVSLGLLVATLLAAPPAMLLAVLGGFEALELEDDVTKRLEPNQGVRRGARTALLAGGLSALSSALTVALAFAVVSQSLGAVTIDSLMKGPLSPLIPSNVRVAVALCLVFASLYGLIGFLAYGGYAYLSHYALRFALFGQGAMPLRYVEFLDFACDRRLLLKAGGGFKFIHPSLAAYFRGLRTVAK